MTKAGFPLPIQVSKYADVARLHVLYTEIKKHAAWGDLMARVQRMRADIASELLTGTMDKFGNSRDSEKRAVLVSLDRILAFAPAVHRQYEQLTKKKEEQEEKLKRKSGIHGEDVLQGTSSESPGITAGGFDGFG